MITTAIKNVATTISTAWLVEVPFPKNIKNNNKKKQVRETFWDKNYPQ